MGPSEILAALLLMVVVFFFRRGLSDAFNDLNQGIKNFVDSLRGGPPTPMHPSPADDGALLRRRSPKIEN
jgi:hypothetical protein